MPPRFIIALASATVAAAIAMPSCAAMASTAKHHRHFAAHHHHAVRHAYTPDDAYGPRAAPAPYAPAYADGSAPFYGPSYVFIPGRGIAGEACNMPTSTCTNEYRDVR